eukprot:2285367-Amphidinium_carterae.1
MERVVPFAWIIGGVWGVPSGSSIECGRKCRDVQKCNQYQEGKNPGIGKPQNPQKYPHTLRNK